MLGDSPQYFALLWCHHTRFTLHHTPQLNVVWWWGQSHRPLWVRGVGHLGAAWAWEDLTGGGHHFDPHYLAWEGGGTPLTLIIRGPGKSLRQGLVAVGGRGKGL